MDKLLEAVRQYAEFHADAAGLCRTPVGGLTMVRATAPSELQHSIARPMVCLVVQGSKLVTSWGQPYAFGAGDSLIVTADVPTVSQITRASAPKPYLSLVMELDMAVIAELSAQMGGPGDSAVAESVNVVPTDAELADVALRLVRLIERPQAMAVLQASAVRELHYWLLVGRHGPAVRELGWPGSHAQRIGRAVATLRSDFARAVPVETLAASAGMSLSSFHLHFRRVTSLSPLQFQKQLRLIEARRLMLADGLGASSAAFAVGYESVSHFTREYGRLFGSPPVRDMQAARMGRRAPDIAPQNVR
jgi:AraC-like DNA-binding protein